MRTLENWRECLTRKDGAEVCTFILGDLTGYPLHSAHQNDDEKELSVAITAYLENKEAELEEYREALARRPTPI